MMRMIGAALGTMMLFPHPCTTAAKEIAGVASRVIDGDTLYICDAALCEKIRICGINAPERREKGGREATSAMRAIAADNQIRCVPVGEGTVCDGRSKRTSRDRIVAQCFVGKFDIAELLVKQGYACDWAKFSGGYYSREGQGAICR
jgi:endonuclease YncB( thermonuclease family)